MKIIDKKKINNKIIKQINKLLIYLKADYKDLAEEMDYSDNAYTFKILKGEKIINIHTLVRISLALISINKARGNKLNDSLLLPSNIFKQIGL